MLAGHFNLWFKEHLNDYPGNYLETGVFDGDGIRTLALAYPKKNFYGIDPFIEDGWTTHATGFPKGKFMESLRDQARRNCNLPNIGLLEMSSSSFFERLTDEKAKGLAVDFVLIDGSHQYPDATNDLRMAEYLIQKEGIIGVDDLHVPDVAKAFGEWRKRLGNHVEDTGYDRCAILRFKR